MLSRISISNFTLIDKIDIYLQTGLTTITGQTGAGKSIFLGALSLVTGKRASSDLLFDAEKKCVIEAEFTIASKQIDSFLKTNDFDQNETVILRRELLPSGKSRSFINDTPATLKQLAEIGNGLIDIHEQHENQKLSQNEYRTFLLDAYGGHLNLTQSYQQQFKQVKTLSKALAQLKEEIANKRKERDYFQFLFDEIEEANIQLGELADKENLLGKLEHAEEIKTTLYAIQTLLTNENSGLIGGLHNAERQIEGVAAHSNDLADLASRIKAMRIELDDISNELDVVESSVEINPEELSIAQERVNQIHQLFQKHQVADEIELEKIKNELESNLGAILGGESEIEELELKLTKEESELNKLASELSKARARLAKNLCLETTNHIKLLGIAEGKFEVALKKYEQLTQSGAEEVYFNFTANKGKDLKSVVDAASGGELSRLLLSLKAQVSQNSALPTIVFDEIDTGVSGEVANKMGELMKKIAQKIQVIAITHLPQVAAKGKQHLFVFKEHTADKTYTKIEPLHADARVIELAKMLSGDKLSSVAKENARILLKN